MRLLLEVKDVFEIAGLGLLISPDVPYPPPKGFSNFTGPVTLIPPSGGTHEVQAQFSLMHLNPGGYKLLMSFPNVDKALIPVGSSVLAPEAVHARLMGADA
jgi:hypothetical protein